MKTLFIGQHAIYLTTVDSTNSYASEMLRQNTAIEGTIIYTFNQTNGRGQRGNTWLGEPNKNVALSLILTPGFLDAKDQFLLTKIISLSVADLMAELLQNQGNCTIKIKWPNDIYVNDKKIAGILIENTLAKNTIQNSIIGIGLNVNQTEFSREINATSLKKITSAEFDLKEVIARLCDFIEARYLQLKCNKLDNLNHAYLKYLYRLNSWEKYSVTGKIFEGKIIGITASGKLELESHSGLIEEYDLKEIVFEP
jgi:BirA family biotin operon repressor/biotin-[acetyl-CoA-carboxylase] ligase